MADKYTKANERRPSWSYRIPLDLKEDLEALKNNDTFQGSKQKILDHLIRLGLQAYQLEQHQQLLENKEND